MAEDTIRCSKCGSTVSGETCTACGAIGQAAKCEHCGNLCPGDAKWCPSCGRHLSGNASTEAAAPDAASMGTANLVRLVGLLCLVVVLCIFILRSPQPAAGVIGGLSLAFLAAGGTLAARIRRVIPLLVGAAAAALLSALFTSSPRSASHGPVLMPAMRLASPESDEQFAPGKILVRFKDGGLDHQRANRDFVNAWLSSPSGRHGINWNGRPPFVETIDPDTHDVTVEFISIVPVEAVVRAFGRDPEVVFAEPDYILEASHTPNDPYVNEKYDATGGPLNQWYLTNIQAPEAWDKLKPTDSQLRLAIIDTGIDFKHPDLKDRIALNSKGEIVGRNFVNLRQPPLDDNGHGTHCAGIADGAADNKIGIAGVGLNSFKLVPVKVLTGKGFGELGWIARAITWAADNGCRVESLSLGGNRYSQALQDAVNYAWSKGTVVVAAAGNAATSRPGYPAGCNHVVAISATDPDDRLASFSNYGVPIAVGAPGVRILSTMPTYPCDLTRSHGYKENYDGLSGTSMACPVASGVLASLLAFQPSLSATQAIERLEQTADNTARVRNGGWEVQFGHGRVNLANAILNRQRGATVGSFYGQVIDKAGLPIMGAVVRCGAQSVTTPDSGMFRLANLPAGSYKIQVSVGKAAVSETAAVAPGADRNVTVTVAS